MSGRKKRRETPRGRERPDATESAAPRREFYPDIRSWFAAKVVSEQDADDLAQEVLARLARKRAPDGRKAYIAAAMANALSRCRCRRARERTALCKLLAVASRMGHASFTGQPEEPSDDGQAIAKCAEIAEILRTLPPEEAKLLKLRFVDGLPMAEVARRVECSREAAYKRFQWIIRRLRERYGVQPNPAKNSRK